MSTRNALVSIYHNILWSKYKGVVFSELHSLSCHRGVTVSFIQVAETEEQRVSLTGVDLSYHQYPYRLLFHGAYETVPVYRRVFALAKDLIRNRSDFVVLPNYNLIEHWVMLVICVLLRRKRAVICDSINPSNSVPARWKEWAKGIFFRQCNGYFCYGIRSKQYLLSYGVDEAKIRFRRQAAALPPAYDPEQVREHYAGNPTQPATAPRYVYIGRFSEEKGLFDLLEAIKQVRARLPDATLCLVGGGPLQAALVERIDALGLNSTVKLAGALSLDQIGPILMDSTALVLPSHREPWGLVVNEALSYGCPVVVSSVCGCVPELVKEGITGYCFEAGNVDALIRAMDSVAQLSVDRLAVAKDCLDAIVDYTPKNAASQMLDGCIELLATA
jgi:glycosyltransferase involved in cell wall biosynthesis